MQELTAASCGFRPLARVGTRLEPGAILGEALAGTGLVQRCPAPPDLAPGEVVEIAGAGEYREDEPVCRVRDSAGEVHAIAMSHRWPVRIPRPVAKRLRSDKPMLTGQRILDCLFPVACGGTAAIPGGFGTGKTIRLETVAKWCSAEVIVYVGCLWALDARRAQARFYPAIHPLQSYSIVAHGLARWWHAQAAPRWEELRRRFLTLLEEEARLERMARIMGRDAMPERQRLTLLCAQLVNRAFLRQSAFSQNDRYASPTRQSVMMQLIGCFIEESERLLEAGVPPEEIAETPLFRSLTRMGEEIPEGAWDRFAALDQELTATVRHLLAQREAAEAAKPVPATEEAD
jgi:vacuolar-type H+-ATPase catalytic subunit A/Vma1